MMMQEIARAFAIDIPLILILFQVALSALAAAATAQRAGPVALVNPVQVALDGFSEDVNQDGFVDPIAPAVAPLGLGYGAALPLGGYGLGYGAGIWKRDAEPQWLAYGKLHTSFS